MATGKMRMVVEVLFDKELTSEDEVYELLKKGLYSSYYELQKRNSTIDYVYSEREF
jgi:hypothetical protein